MSKADLEIIKKDLFALKELLQKETGFLVRNELDPLKDLYEEKLELIERIDQMKKHIRESAYRPDPQSPEAQEIRLIGEELDQIMAKHGKELIRAREVNRIVLNAIAHAVAEHFKDAHGYTENGDETQYLAKGESAVPPIHINEHL